MLFRDCRPESKRRGSVLIEFALVAFIFYMLLGAVVSFGYLLYVAQGLQHTADLAAREISRTPLSPTDTLETVLYGNANTQMDLLPVRRQVFDQHFLALNVDPSSDFQGKGSLQNLINSLPVVNQQLVPLMQSDVIGGVRFLRYPGAVFTDEEPSDDPPFDPSDPASPPRASGLLVAIPRVVSRDPATGVETVDLVRVVEEIESPDPANIEFHNPFLITKRFRGIVALRFNYPVQSSTLTAFQSDPNAPFAPNGSRPFEADDSSVSVVDQDGFSPDVSSVQSDAAFGPNAGAFGLGRQAALAQNVRPFRRLVTAQAIYRREVFGN